MKYYITFGEFLNYIIKSRNLNTTKLAEMTGNKSKTTIVRLLNDESSSKAIFKFSEKLREAVDLTDDEIVYMEQALENEPISRVERQAMDNLLTLYGSAERSAEGMNKFILHDDSEINTSLEEIFSVCLDKDSMIILEDVVNSELIFVINDLIHKTKDHSLKINHFFRADDGLEAKGKQVLALMSLSTYLNYNAYECDGSSKIGKRVIILTKNNSSYNMRIIEYIDNRKCHYIDTPVTEDFYNYILCRQRLLTREARPLRSEPLKSDQLLGMLEMMQKTDRYPTLHIGSSPCYIFIPFDIQCRLFEACNYIGLGRDNPYIQKLYNILQQRTKFIAECKIPRKMIFTVDGIKSFLQIGKTGDYFAPFERMTPEECVRTLKYFMSVKGVRFKLFKENYTVGNTDVFVCANRSVFIYDTVWGWWEGSTTSRISDKRMIKLVTDFYNGRLWRKCCYSEEKSRKIVESMIRDYKKEMNL